MSQIGPLINHAVPVALGLSAFYWPFNSARIMASFMTLRGITGVVNPIGLGKQFGIPWADEKNTTFVPAVGARSTAAGLLALILSFQGHREALATHLACLMLNGVGDAYVLLSHPGSQNLSAHILGIGALGTISFCLFQGTA